MTLHRYQLYTIITILLVAAVFLVFLYQGNKPQRSRISRCDGCNIVFVSFDTLRADHVHALGYPRVTTPTIDALASKGFVFTNAVSVAPWTLPSTMSWFTGVYPTTHKVINKFILDTGGREEIANLKKLSPGIVTVAEVFKNQGYRTGGFTGGAGVDRQFGFNQGFEMYTDDLNFGGFKESIPKALLWIEEHKREKLFVFLHGYDIHGQYVPDGGYDKRFIDFNYKGNLTGSKEEQKTLREEGLSRGKISLTSRDVRFLTALYDEKIARADAEFATFLRAYTAMGLMDKTILVITSDHGEELYEHGQIDHGHSLYDELVRVPLFIILPNQKNSVYIQDQVRSIDLMPTLFDLTNISGEPNLKQQMQGTSLVPTMEGFKEALDIFPETDYRYAVSQKAVRTPSGFKLIKDTERLLNELYNIKSDAGEKDDLSQKEPGQVSALNILLQNHRNKIR